MKLFQAPQQQTKNHTTKSPSGFLPAHSDRFLTLLPRELFVSYLKISHTKCCTVFFFFLTEIFLFLFFFPFRFSVFMNTVFCLYACWWTVCIQCPKEGCQIPGTGVTDSCEPPWRSWESNLSLLEEWPVLLSGIDSSFQLLS